VLVMDYRHQITERLTTVREDLLVETIVDVWSRLESELVVVIGNGGFQSLYARSIYLTGVKFPWMTQSRARFQSEARYDDLQRCFAGRNMADVRDSSIFLLSTFVDILVSLIGEWLTTGILRAAWEQALNDMGAGDIEVLLGMGNNSKQPKSIARLAV
jgi:hypothetical protein